MKYSILIILALLNFNSHSQTIVEGKGVDSIYLGLKKFTIIQLLGNNYKSVTYDYGHTGLIYEDKKLEILFDKYHDVSFEIIISSGFKGKTTKGLEVNEDLTVKDIFDLYGDEWYFYKNQTIGIQYDFGISFKTEYSPSYIEKDFSKNIDFLSSKISTISIEENEDDNSFQEYLDGEYIPLNIDEAYSELIRLIPPQDIDKYKRQNLQVFLADAHFGIGRNIRNNWMLWKNSRLALFLINKGVTHPDDMSTIILMYFHSRINNKIFDIDKEIEKYKDKH